MSEYSQILNHLRWLHMLGLDETYDIMWTSYTNDDRVLEVYGFEK